MYFRVPLKSSPSIGPTSPASLRLQIPYGQFLSGPNSRPEWRELKFSAICILRSPDPGNSLSPPVFINAAATDFTNLVGSVEQGYTAIRVEGTLASHLSPSLAPSWMSRPLFPTKPCRTTSVLIGKSSWSGRYGPPHDGHPPSLPGRCP